MYKMMKLRRKKKEEKTHIGKINERDVRVSLIEKDGKVSLIENDVRVSLITPFTFRL